MSENSVESLLAEDYLIGIESLAGTFLAACRASRGAKSVICRSLLRGEEFAFILWQEQNG